jgi:hypothetical protein
MPKHGSLGPVLGPVEQKVPRYGEGLFVSAPTWP